MTKKIAILLFAVLVVASAVYALRDQRKVTTDSDKAYKAYIAGQEFLDRLYVSDAAVEFEKAVKLDTNFAMAYARLGMLYASLYNKRDDAKKLMAKAVAQFPHIKEKERLMIQIMQADLEGNAKAVQDFRETFLKKYPESLEAHVFQAQNMLVNQDYEPMIKEYQKILKIDPNYALALNMLGYGNYYLRNYDEAIDYIKKYAYLASDQANPHDSYGEILMNIGKYDEAIAEFKAADKIKPDLAFVQSHLGDVYGCIGRVRDAVGYYLRAKDRSSSDKDKIGYEINIARIYWENLGFERGLSALEEVLAAHPNELSVWGWSAFAYACNGDIKKARRASAKVDSLAVALLDTMPGVGVKSTAKELGNLKKLINGMISSQAGDQAQAIILIKDVVDNSPLPNRIWFRCFLGDAYVKMGDLAKARDIFLANLQDNPNHAQTLKRLADLYKTLKQTDNQKEMLLRYLSVMSGADDEVVAVKTARTDLNRLLQL